MTHLCYWSGSPLFHFSGLSPVWRYATTRSHDETLFIKNECHWHLKRNSMHFCKTHGLKKIVSNIYVFIEVISDLSLVHFRHNKGKIINIGIKYIRGIKVVDINTKQCRNYVVRALIYKLCVSPLVRSIPREYWKIIKTNSTTPSELHLVNAYNRYALMKSFSF